MEETEEKCWLCKRGLIEAIEEFNKMVLEDKSIDNNVKSNYKKGRKEFFPLTTDKVIEFLLADVDETRYSLTGKVIGDIYIRLCPVCSGLLDSLSSIDIENFVTKEELEDVSISIR